MGPTIYIQHLTDTKSPNFLTWLTTFEQIHRANNWDDVTSLNNMRLVVSHKVSDLLINTTTFEEAIIKLKSSAFPLEDYRIYKNMLNNIHRKNQHSLKNYADELTSLTNRANKCLEGTDYSPITNREIFDIFIKGLPMEDQRILIEKGILNIQEAYDTLLRIEISRKLYFDPNKNVDHHKPRKNGYNNNRTQQDQWCKYHRSSKHSTEDCIKLKTLNQSKTNNEPRKDFNNFQKHINNKNLIHEIIGINGIKTSALVDTGADLNFISTQYLEKIKLKPLSISPKTVEIGNGKLIIITKSVKIKLNLESFPSESYSTEAYVFPGNVNDFIIGQDFLALQDIHIDNKNKRIYKFDERMKEITTKPIQFKYYKTKKMKW